MRVLSWLFSCKLTRAACASAGLLRVRSHLGRNAASLPCTNIRYERASAAPFNVPLPRSPRYDDVADFPEEYELRRVASNAFRSEKHASDKDWRRSVHGRADNVTRTHRLDSRPSSLQVPEDQPPRHSWCPQRHWPAAGARPRRRTCRRRPLTLHPTSRPLRGLWMAAGDTRGCRGAGQR